VAQATEGSVANVLAVGQGQIEAAFAQADVATWAYRGAAPVIAPSKACRGAQTPPQNGTEPLAKAGPIRNLRVIAALYPEAVHVVARSASGIHTIADLKGKTVALGEPGSGTLAETRLILHASALQECQLKARYLRLSDASASIENEKLDAFFLMAGAPVPAIIESASMERVRLVPIAGKPRDALLHAYPFMTAATIPGATYPGIDSETQTIAVPALLVVSAALPDDLAYGITKALWQDATRRLLDNGHPAGKAIRIENALQGVVIPLHPGAARFYTERGLTLPAEAMAPATPSSR
jgi:TRAP transporter TAXI family solute receptor